MKRLSVVLLFTFLFLTLTLFPKTANAADTNSAVNTGNVKGGPFYLDIDDCKIEVNLKEGEVLHFGFAKLQSSGTKANPKKNLYEIDGKVYKVSSIVSLPWYDYVSWYDISYLKGKDVTFAYGVTFSEYLVNFDSLVHVGLADKRFKVFYRGTKFEDNAEVKVSRSIFRGSEVNAVMVGTPDGGYYYFTGEIKGAKGDEADVQLISPSEVIFRRDGSEMGWDYAETLRSVMPSLMLNGSTLWFKKLRDVDSWYSKDVKVKYPRQLSAPTVKTNINKETVTLTTKLEYRVYINGERESDWIDVKAYHPDIKGQQLSFYDLIIKVSENGDKERLQKSTVEGSRVSIEIRTKAKAKNQPSKSKTLSITLEEEEE